MPPARVPQAASRPALPPNHGGPSRPASRPPLGVSLNWLELIALARGFLSLALALAFLNSLAACGRPVLALCGPLTHVNLRV